MPRSEPLLRVLQPRIVPQVPGFAEAAALLSPSADPQPLEFERGQDGLYLVASRDPHPQWRCPFILDSSYAFTAGVEIKRGGAGGMIVTRGGRFGGYGFHLLKGKTVFPCFEPPPSAAAGRQPSEDGV
jgi:hypothetical protein